VHGLPLLEGRPQRVKALRDGVIRGSPGDPDIFGAQQYAPLLDIEVPDG